MNEQFVNEFELTHQLYRDWTAHPVVKKVKSARKRSLILVIIGVALSLLIIADGIFWVHNIFAIVTGCIFLALFLIRLFIMPEILRRRQYSQLKSMNPDGSLLRRNEFGDEIQVASGRMTVSYKYSEITALEENEQYFMLFLGENEVLRLPKTAFTLGDAASFRNFILERINAAKAA